MSTCPWEERHPPTPPPTLPAGLPAPLLTWACPLGGCAGGSSVLKGGGLGGESKSSVSSDTPGSRAVDNSACPHPPSSLWILMAQTQATRAAGPAQSCTQSRRTSCFFNDGPHSISNAQFFSFLLILTLAFSPLTSE